MKVRAIRKYRDLQLERIVEENEELRVRKERGLELEKAGVAEIIQEETREEKNTESTEPPPGEQ